MTAPSVSPSFPPQEDDEFDWEAAVKEIDVACQLVGSTSNQEDFANSLIPFSKLKTSVGTRQSTLDNFVRTGEKCRAAHIPILENGHPSFSSGSNSASSKIDLEAAKTWIYPVNVPLRDYQLSITEKALFSNTLVALPTGLGKTLIAAVVMYNYFRWFPEGKIVFAAPSRPLVMQQIEACHNIMGIPQEWTIDMTGQMSPSKREHFWKAKRVFFLTPQVLEKDIQSGICLMKQLVCLVIDEAHRAMGNYSYCVAVRELMAVPVQLRIVALTATPGSKQKTIQNVIDNLHISTLEYRNENDHDVSPYVHNRKLELMEVTMGKDANEINNLLLEAIQPFASRLCAAGVLYKRDFATLSPCDLLTSRDKFRQEPPINLPHAKYGEIDGCFGILITLYHIRKLLSSHGIRPAFEMLEEKLKQGSFARLMCRNEKIWRVKLLMQQSLSHGAPSPKLVKMIEVLTNHFKTNDPKDSRVIIFSNFRGSVKDIMYSLSNIGEFVKATQFIGQSSGKSIKGQTQKVQQEVLRKFRAGEYNVIVATSIGEEGLDIMEVDLVICFDANISPLRMIQRMGRTGRKHDGRVVVLACQGPELKGYLKKQASSKAVRKHMHNGGSNSFNFHCSPRMVPHICKPQVQFVELSIEQFIPRGRKVKDLPIQKPSPRTKIIDAEADIIAKYFRAFEEATWKPSLIAFPHFQTFPSRIHKVKHSSRTTGLLIDSMQSLQGLLPFRLKKFLPAEVLLKASSNQHLQLATIAGDDNREIADSTTVHDYLKILSQSKTLDVETSPEENSNEADEHFLPDLPSQILPVHCFLFGADYVSVDTSGRVLISSYPVIPFVTDGRTCKHDIHSKTTGLQMNSSSRSSPPRYGKLNMNSNANTEIMESDSDAVRHKSKWIMASLLPERASQGQALNRIQEPFLQTPNSDNESIDSQCRVAETPSLMEMEMKRSIFNESKDDLRDVKLSPRLTIFVEKGVVPESPVVKNHFYSSTMGHIICRNLNDENYQTVLDSDYCIRNMDAKKSLFDTACPRSGQGKESPFRVHVSPNSPKLISGPTSKKMISENKMDMEMEIVKISENKMDMEMENTSCSPVNEIQTPLVRRRDHSSSEDWQLSSGEASMSIQQPHKFRRLCKYKDIEKKLASKSKEARSAIQPSLCRSSSRTKFSPTKQATGKQMPKTHVTAFIDEEAEVSADAEVSEDEEDVDGNNEYVDSFIDDRMSSQSNQTEGGGIDMIAIYRKSLLTQSPLMQSNYSNTSGYESTSPTTAECESHSKMVNNSFQSPQSNLYSENQSTGKNSIYCQLDAKKALLSPVIGTQGHSTKDESKIDSRKRKRSFQQVASVSVTCSRQEECVILSEATGKSSHLYQPPECNKLYSDIFYDDQFYLGLDLDAVEAQATESLRFKTSLSIGASQKEHLNPYERIEEDLNLKCAKSPSFDLGI